jgi:Icc-related predicted phosphoesterase
VKILAVADIHGRHDVYAWLIEIARVHDPSAVILAGDLLGFPDGFDTPESAQENDRHVVCAALDRLTQPVFYIMGNDDWVDLEGALPRQRSLHGRRVDLGELNLVGYQHTLPFMGGVNEKPESAIASDLVTLESLVDSKTVLVTHGPAYGVLDIGVFDQSAGSTSLADLVARRSPLAHIHGHVHSQFGRADRHFNVASGGLKRAMLIDPETMEHEVVSG